MFELKIKGEKEIILLDETQGEKIRVAWLHHKHDGEDGTINFKADGKEYDITLSSIKSIARRMDERKHKSTNERIKQYNNEYIRYRIQKLKHGQNTKFFELLYYAITGKDPSLEEIMQAQIEQEKFFNSEEGRNRIYPDPSIFNEILKINPKAEGKSMLKAYDAARPGLLRILASQIMTDMQFSKYSVQNLENMIK